MVNSSISLTTECEVPGCRLNVSQDQLMLICLIAFHPAVSLETVPLFYHSHIQIISKQGTLFFFLFFFPGSQIISACSFLHRILQGDFHFGSSL